MVIVLAKGVDIGLDGACEESGVLGDDGDVMPQVVEPKL